MADLDHQHDEFSVLDIADDAVVANPVTPETVELWPLQGGAFLARVIERFDASVEIVPDALRLGVAQLLELFDGELPPISTGQSA
ncbi:hypothetical protein J2045_000603 [Peteryoungia aggregata LMG 23059]|uniref:WYL domain-containing protein n=1 Tax=Peteryoungia aggregata LMG 23059 TaxID=1368425 RepID=A0ABU0G4G5_9HYPH|nr:hypothetical protein [Peteryoungia aggregata LMG 23059]